MTRIDARPGEVANAAPAPAPAGDGDKKKGPPKKETYPGLANGKLSAIPDDYNPKVHAALKEDDFEAGKLDVYYRYKADNYDRQAKSWRRKADKFAQLGGVADKKTAQKILDMQDSMKKQLEKLLAQGDDLSALPAELLKMAGIELPAAEAPAEA